MNGRSTTFSLIFQLFLLFTFLCAPIADSAHAIRMSQTKHGQTSSQSTVVTPHKKMIMAANMPCHEPMMMSVETLTPDTLQTNKPGDKQACCPYKQCSPNNCLMQFAMVSLFLYEMKPHSPIDNRVFVDADIHLVSVPASERLRPPIA